MLSRLRPMARFCLSFLQSPWECIVLPCEHGEKSPDSATLSAKSPLFRVFTIGIATDSVYTIGTVGGHLGDRPGAGVGRVGRGDRAVPVYPILSVVIGG